MPVQTNPTDIARETLKLLAARRVAPTPENFTRLYHEIAGIQPDDAAEERIVQTVRQAADAYPGLSGLSRVARALEEGDYSQFSAALVGLAGGRETALRPNWGLLLRDLLRQLEMRQTGVSLARKREGLERVLVGFSNDASLFDKLEALVRTWAETQDPSVVQIDTAGAGVPSVPAPTRAPAVAEAELVRQLRDLLAQTLDYGLAARLGRFPDLAADARKLAANAREADSTEAWAKYTAQLRQFFFRLDALLRLLGLMLQNIGELVDQDQWVSGQLEVMREVIKEPLSTDKINEAERRFKDLIYKQGMLKHSLTEAKSSLKRLIAMFLQRLAELTA